MTETVKRHLSVNLLVKDFSSWLAVYKRSTPFRRYGQLEYHRQTIDRRFELGSAKTALTDERFLKSLYETLQAWGIGSRASRLKPYAEFCTILQTQSHLIADLQDLSIDNSSLNTADVADQLWRIIDNLHIVENAAKLVPVT